MDIGIIQILLLFLTAIGYGVFPMLFTLLRKQAITKQKYSVWCFVVNFVVWLGLVLLAPSATEIVSSGAAFLFWTWIFSRIGAGLLDDKGMLDKPNGKASEGPSR